jgi:cell division protein FtsB
MSDMKWDAEALQSALLYYKNRSVQLEYELVLFKAAVEKKIKNYEDVVNALKAQIEKLQPEPKKVKKDKK